MTPLPWIDNILHFRHPDLSHFLILSPYISICRMYPMGRSVLYPALRKP